MPRARCTFVLVVILAVFLLALLPAAIPAGEVEYEAPVAIRNLTLIPQPGEKLEGVTVVMDKGRFVAVGADAKVPPGARELDGSGLIAYAGFIDGLTRAGVDENKPDAAVERRTEGEFPSASDGPLPQTVEANRSGVFARRDVESVINIEKTTFEKQRQAGFAAALIAGPRAPLGGGASVILLGENPLRRSLLRTGLAQTASLAPPDGRALPERGRYPSTEFGVIAHLRQTFSDADWYRQMTAYAGRHGEALAEVPYDPDLVALQAVIGGKLPLIWEAQREDEIHRALKLAAEFGIRPLIAGGREAYKALDALKAANIPLILSLEVPAKIKEYKLEAKDYRKAEKDETLYGKSWDKRPFQPKGAYDEGKRVRDETLTNMAKVEAAGLTWCLSSCDMKRPEESLVNLREAIEAGLPSDAALRALTVTPARLFGLERELGTVEVGKRANLAVLSKPLADKDAQLRWVFVDGRQYEYGDGEGAAAEGGRRGERGAERGGERGRGRGRGRERGDEPREARGADEKSDEKHEEGDASTSKPVTSSQAAPPPGPLDDLLLHTPEWPIENDLVRDPGLKLGGSVLLRHATVITMAGDDLPEASVLIRDGKIAEIGRSVQAPEGVTELDLTGCVIMPGMIDPHAHIALDSINEGALSVTPEVRCADVVRHDDVMIYRAAAGGTTTIHAMHGSANTIGGQNVVLKMKYGRPAAELIVHDAPRTVKWATGENVKRGGMTGQRFGEGERQRRFPGTRMGVETTMRRAMSEARRYGEQRRGHESQLAEAADAQDVKPMRRDLRLEALSDILDGKLIVQCHCYRADEILRLLSVAEDYGFRVGGLHHVLEGYQIIPEIARHGCGTATFSDWWAYKIEAYHAVPQNAGMLLRGGVNSAIKSDSSDLMRHLNLEAAKCMKFSRLTAAEALRLVTVNAARLVGVDSHVGSLEVGKDGDVAVFDGHPLDTFSRCVMTIIEGEVYFRHRDFDPRQTRGAPRSVRTFAELAALPPSADGAPPPASVTSVPPAGGAARGGAANVYAITNATLHPVSGPPIERGTLVIREGRIAAIGRDVSTPAGATVVDATGRHVWPGLINAATEAGMQEIESIDVTLDTAEPGTYQPDNLAVSALNPQSAMIETTRAEGITTALLIPESPRVAAQAGLVNLAGWTMPEMLIEPRVGLIVNLPSKPAEGISDDEDRPRGRRGRGPNRPPEQEDETPDATARELKETERFFRDARLFAEASRAARAGGEPRPSPADPRFEAMMPYVLGEKPVLFIAGSYKSILEAVMFAEQLKLKAVILGGRDAWRCADVLAARRIPVIFEGTFGVPREPDAWDAQYRALSILSKAGVTFAIGQRSASLAKLVPVEAGFAVAHGLDPDAAVRAMTLSAAEILGVSDRLGSLEVGKVADVIITTDHVCQATNVVTDVLVRGRPVLLDSQHSRLADKFAHRPAPELPPRREDLAGASFQSKGDATRGTK
ncbi:MAG: Imidazolonepropionase [Phycisphaerae bacterium]|nr:Imidazolonepropionase [Phycisphaerae bacterium]